MQAIAVVRACAARPTALRQAAARRSAAAPARRLRLPLAASASGVEGASEFARLVAAGGKVAKTAVAKLPVAELRGECERLGLPTDGLKAALVERLVGWWQQQQVQQAQQQQTQPEQQQQQQAPPEQAQARQHAAEQAAADAPAASPAPADARAPGDGEQQQQEAQQDSDIVSVTWLGTSSGNPTPRRNVSAIAVRFGPDLFLVDCGEGTRNQMRRAGLDPAAVRRICVTHMHGDHCFGVGGVVEAVCEARLGTPLQHEPLYLYGPPELQSQVLACIRMGAIQLTTPLVVTGFVLDPARARPPAPADPAGMLRLALQGPDQAARLPADAARRLQEAYDAGSERVVRPGLTWTVRVPGGPAIAAAQLQHRVPCWGYVFQEPPRPAAVPASAAAAVGGAPPPPRGDGGAPLRWARRGRKLVILGDTCDSTAIAPLAAGCDLLSHEATFCSGMEDKAAVAQHSTTEQAGAFAAAVDARALVLTHFSARYESLSGLAHGMRATSNLPRAEARAEVASKDLQRSEMARLLSETRRTYGRDSVHLASDFYTHEVAPPQPVPADKLAQQQAEAAAAAQRAAAAAAAAVSAQQRPPARGWQDRRQQQRRPAGRGQGQGQRQPQWDRRPRTAAP